MFEAGCILLIFVHLWMIILIAGNEKKNGYINKKNIPRKWYKWRFKY